jgi:patatin-like phospholipase/acyl hydrolase
MAVTVPSTDVNNFNLQAQIAALAATISANTTPELLPVLTQQLDLLQQQLINSLMANATARRPVVFGVGPSFLTASQILSTGTVNT